MNRRLRKFLWLVVVGTLILGVGSAVEASLFDATEGPLRNSCSYFSGRPVLDLELSSSSDCFEAIINQGDRNHNLLVIRTNTYIDFAFIGFYWAAFVSIALVHKGTWTNWTIMLISAAAVIDCFENFRILSAITALMHFPGASFPTPRTFSVLKWWALSAALLAATMTLRRAQRRYSRLLNLSFFVAGVLIIPGLYIAKFMIAAAVAFSLTLVVAAVCYFPWSTQRNTVLAWVEMLYLMRFQLIAAFVLVIVLPTCYVVIPSISIGLFDARQFWSFVFVTWAAFQLAWTIMITCRLVLAYGPVRLGVHLAIAAAKIRARTVVLFGALATPCLAFMYVGSQDLSWYEKGGGFALGLMMAVATLYAISIVHVVLEGSEGGTASFVFPSFGSARLGGNRKRSKFWTYIDGRISSLPSQLQPGLIRDNRLQSGHQLGAVALFFFCCLYALVGIVYSPSWTIPENQPAALFFVLLLLILFVWLLSGLAFFLDAAKLPVLSSLILLSFLTGFLPSDHEYAITRAADTWLTSPPSEVIYSWSHSQRRRAGRAITIVATAGSGIRASFPYRSTRCGNCF